MRETTYFFKKYLIGVNDSFFSKFRKLFSKGMIETLLINFEIKQKSFIGELVKSVIDTALYQIIQNIVGIYYNFSFFIRTNVDSRKFKYASTIKEMVLTCITNE